MHVVFIKRFLGGLLLFHLFDISGSLTTWTKFIYVPDGINWSPAKDECLKYGGQLIQIENQVKNNILISLLLPHFDIDSIAAFSIGLRAADENSPFEWLTGTPLTWVNWGAAQTPAIGKLCSKALKSRLWAPAKCDYSRHYVCEFHSNFSCPYQNHAHTSLYINGTLKVDVVKNDFTVKKCKDLCSQNGECWAFEIDQENSICKTITSTNPPEIKQSMYSDSSSSLYVKECYLFEIGALSRWPPDSYFTTSTTVLTTETTNTERITSTEASTTTSEAITSTEADTTTEVAITSTKADTTTSEAITSTKADTTTSEAITSTKADTTTSEAITSTKADTTTSEAITSTKADTTTSEAITSTKADTTTSEAITSTKADTTTSEAITSTKADATTSEAITSTEADTTTSEAITSTKADTTTSEVITSTEADTTTSEAITSTEADTTSEAITSTKADTTSEIIPLTEDRSTISEKISSSEKSLFTREVSSETVTDGKNTPQYSLSEDLTSTYPSTNTHLNHTWTVIAQEVSLETDSTTVYTVSTTSGKVFTPSTGGYSLLTYTPFSLDRSTNIQPGQKLTTQITDQEPSSCLCWCIRRRALTDEEKRRFLQRLLSKLDINKRTLSSNKRKRESQEDNRLSVLIIGYGGVFIICLVCIFPTFIDLTNIFCFKPKQYH